jgi:hypothetical protein
MACCQGQKRPDTKKFLLQEVRNLLFEGSQEPDRQDRKEAAAARYVALVFSPMLQRHKCYAGQIPALGLVKQILKNVNRVLIYRRLY